MKKQKLFGTDGIRGKANVFPIDVETVTRLGQAIGIHFKKKHLHPRILIGKDTRISGYLLEQALSAGICSVGVDTFFLGPLPTPGIAYLTRGMRANAGIVISASHNPYHDNGIKIFSADGYKLPDADEARLEQMVFSGDFGELPTGKSIGVSERIVDAVGQYAVFLKEQFPKKLTLEGMRIVLDCADGAAYKVAPKVLTELGAEVFPIHCHPDGSNINNNCGALYPDTMAENVQLYKANLGIALDGDADRLILADENGEILDGDEILAILGRYLIEEGRLPHKTIVATQMSNLGLEEALKPLGGKVVRTQVGDRHVVKEMRENGYTFGGEQSGHLVFKDFSTTGDGLLAALLVLEVVISRQQPLSSLKKCIAKFPQVLKNIDVTEKVPQENLKGFNKALKTAQTQLGKKSRVVFRYSGTENKARLLIEGPQLETIDKIASSLALQLQHDIEKHCKHD